MRISPVLRLATFLLLAAVVAACEPKSTASPAAATSLPAPASPAAPASTPTASVAPPVPDPPVASAPEVHAPQQSAIGRKNILVVTFISPGNGTDHAASGRLGTMLRSEARVPPFVSHSWGKEGEHDECFDLSSLSPAERTAFVARVNAAVKSPRVTVTENGECRPGR